MCAGRQLCACEQKKASFSLLTFHVAPHLQDRDGGEDEVGLNLGLLGSMWHVKVKGIVSSD